LSLVCEQCGHPECGLPCTALDALPLAIARVDLTGTITYSNAAHERLLGRSHDEVLGSKVWDFMASRSGETGLRERFRGIVEGRPRPQPLALHGLTAGGDLIEGLVDWRYELGKDGELLGFIALVSDVGREQALHSALQRIGMVLIEQGICSHMVPTEADDRRVPGLSSLSPREREVVDLLAKGYRAPSIARRLHISPNTVRNHLKKAYQKLGVHSQEELLDLVTGRE